MSSAVPVHVRRVEDELQADLAKVRKLAKLLDAQFEIAGQKVGWDAIVGLVPVVGDCLTAIVGAYPIYVARKHKLGRGVQARMAMNLLIDWGVGEIPIFGDLFDVAYKANLKNANLLDAAVRKRTKIS